jgi:hypothetical protein
MAAWLAALGVEAPLAIPVVVPTSMVALVLLEGLTTEVR